MTARARRIAHHEQAPVLALPALRERRVLVPEVLPDAARGGPSVLPAVEVVVPPTVAWGVDPYRHVAPPPGQLVDLYV